MIELTVPGVRLIRRVGRGGSGFVWRGEHVADGRPVALKVATRPELDQILVREAEIIALINQAPFASLIDVGRIGTGPRQLVGRVYLVLSWFDGVSIDQLDVPAGHEFEIALAVIRDVSRALSQLHELGFVHGDVKPGNIVVTEDENTGEYHAGLLDLGLAVDMGNGTVAGITPRYFPVDTDNVNVVAPSRDMWALGVTLAELLSLDVRNSERPAQSLREVSLPPPFDKWCAALTSTRPAARPSARWMAARVRDLFQLPSGAEGRRVGRVEATYLRLRRDELREVRVVEKWNVSPRAAGFLHRAAELQERLGRVSAMTSQRSGVLVLRELATQARSRWLVDLVGPSAAAWPMVGELAQISEKRLAEALLALEQRAEPEAWSLEMVLNAIRGRGEMTGGGVVDVAYHSDIDLAVDLTRRPAVLSAIHCAEHRLARGTRGSERLLPLLIRALRSQGKLAEALFWCGQSEIPEVRTLRADLLRRVGQVDEALGILSEDGQRLDSAARAVLARIKLDLGQVEEALGGLGEDSSPQASEVRALAMLTKGATSQVSQIVRGALVGAVDDEQRARLRCVLGIDAHARGQAQEATHQFNMAVMNAARAGAAVEEATYLTGLAAAAVDAGDAQTAISSANRAELLWGYWDKPERLARTLLAHAAAFSLVGDKHDAIEFAEQAKFRAKQVGDVRAEAFSWLVQADVLGAEGRDAAEAAWRLVCDHESEEDRLRVLARLLLVSEVSPDLVEWADGVAANESVAPVVRCDWWGARARACVAGESCGRDQDVRSHVLRLVRVEAPVGSKGLAMYAARILAERAGDGASVRLFSAEQRRLADIVVSKIGADLREFANEQPWIRDQLVTSAATLSSGQVRNLEKLLRSFVGRENPQRLLEQVLDALVFWTGVERGVLLLLGDDGELKPKAARNLAREDLTGQQASLSHSLARKALDTRQPVVAMDAAGEMSSIHESVHALGLRSVLAVPLVARGEDLGVAYLDDRVRAGAFGADELAWVRIVADVAAMAISDARARRSLVEQSKELESVNERLERALAENQARLDVAQRQLAQVQSLPHKYAYEQIVGSSQALHRMLHVIDRVTPTDIPVLIRGESGSGKELVARALHENGPRASFPFLAENCGAIPEALFESILFGHVRGAFTGADRSHVGLFEAGDRGTLFLDEIGELPMSMQAKLLRVLEDGYVRPVGGTSSRKVDVRVVAASNRDLDELCDRGLFRRDLLYRLNVMTIEVPSLRERREDVPLLVEHFVRRYANGRQVTISQAAMRVLQSYDWPGNIRQLENEIRRALVLCGDQIVPEDFSAELVGDRAGGGPVTDHFDLKGRVKELERGLVLDALLKTRGNQSKAAELLGLSRYGLLKMMKRLQIDKDSWRS